MTFFGHPLHPMTVHFPIAFYVLGVGLTLFYLWRGSTEVERFAAWAFILSAVATLLASLAGLVDQSQLEIGDPRLDTVNNHITAGIALLVVNGVLIYMRLRNRQVLAEQRLAYLACMVLGLVLVGVTAWLGGELVYRLGVGVQL